ncbi:MAG: hypothetical protein HQ483_10200 [Rhodospirillales bacterium]|nr:hypothetical protein [Rhodospirillales bacterium]
MNLTERRQFIQCSANPDPARDYVTAMSGHIATSDPQMSYAVRLRYVPDRLILEPDNISAYFARLSACPWPSLEALTTALLGDIQNELVPRWVQIYTEIRWSQNAHLDLQSTLAEDRQPGWKNDDLLARLDV